MANFEMQQTEELIEDIDSFICHHQEPAQLQVKRAQSQRASLVENPDFFAVNQ